MIAAPPLKTLPAVLRRRPALTISLLLLAGTLIVFWPLGHAEFINYDDNLYISENSHVRDGVTWEGVRWAFSADLLADSPNADYWVPVTVLSHLLVIELFGLDPAAHHLVNAALHALNTVLLFLLLQRITGALWRSAVVAALFAVHPLHVESVAWVSERKDVLSGLFLMLTLWAYVRYAEHPARHRYLVVAAVFVLGLMAKPMLVTTPLLLLLLDYWPLGRFSSEGLRAGRGSSAVWKLAWEKAPLFILAVVSAVLTYLAAQREGAVHSFEQTPVAVRLENALVSYVSYIGKMVWPHDLAVLYPYPRDGFPAWQVAGAGVLLVCVSVFAMRERRTRPYVIVGWCWYLVTLAPVIGVVQAGAQAMADRYAYLPLIGLFVIMAWGVEDLTAGWRHRRVLLTVLTGTVLSILMGMTWLQLTYWRNSLTLFEHALTVTDGNYVAQNNLGTALSQQGRADEALGHFMESIRINPDFGMAHNNLGVVLADQGRHEEAIRHYTDALRLSPDLAQVRSNLARELAQRGKTDAAIGLFVEALRLDPDFAPAHDGLGTALAAQGKLEEAVTHFAEALRLNPNLARTHNHLGAVYDTLGRLDEAVLEFEAALRLDPAFSDARMNLERVAEKKSQAGKGSP
jgi:tetratricopeptide (TPR) repeat protein